MKGRIMKKTAFLLCLVALPISTMSARAQTRVDDMKQRTAEIDVLIAAENAKSPFCSAYMGKVVPLTAFGTLAQSLGPKATPKGEFETSAQFSARAQASKGAVALVVLELPVDRDHLRYDADSELMSVEAGAFGGGLMAGGEFSPRDEADLFASAAVKDVTGGYGIHHSESERLIRKFSARNRLGIEFPVDDVELQTNALYFDAPKLFSFARGQDSLVAGLTVSVAEAAKTKKTMRIALVVEPVGPFVQANFMDQLPIKSGDPKHYKYRSTVLVVHARCGLVLDAQSRVLATIDAGGK